MLASFRKMGITAWVLSAFFMLGSFVPAQALDRDRHCERQVRKAEVKLRKAIRRHGPGSRQAQMRREQLERVRARCYR